jgi:hypothetical protein
MRECHDSKGPAFKTTSFWTPPLLLKAERRGGGGGGDPEFILGHGSGHADYGRPDLLPV